MLFKDIQYSETDESCVRPLRQVELSYCALGIVRKKRIIFPYVENVTVVTSWLRSILIRYYACSRILCSYCVSCAHSLNVL